MERVSNEDRCRLIGERERDRQRERERESRERGRERVQYIDR